MFGIERNCKKCGKVLSDLEVKRDNTCAHCGGDVQSIHRHCDTNAGKYSKIPRINKKYSREEIYAFLIENQSCYRGDRSDGEYDSTGYCIYPDGNRLCLSECYKTGDYGSVAVKHIFEIINIDNDGTLNLVEFAGSPKISYRDGARHKNVYVRKGIPKYILEFLNEEHVYITSEFEYSENNITWSNCYLDMENFNQSKAGCYIATCVYGSYDCPEVWILRRYRDSVLVTTRCGKLFIKFYYAISPSLVKLFGEKKWFRKIWKQYLDRNIEKLRKAGYEDAPYTDETTF